jgi:transposase
MWRTRFAERGIAGLHNELKPGRPRSTSEEQIATLVNTALQSKPRGKTHWSRRGLAAETGLSKTTVHRHMTLFGLQPHRSKSFKLSNDPFFIEKVRDVVGLYLNPPDQALVLCVDEKSQVQALQRTQPVLPMGLGYVEGITHDYIRHGTTTLFAALDIANGSVLTQCKAQHRHQEFLSFLRHIEANVPANLDVHLICDNYGTHKHARVRAWLSRRPRFHLHFTPTYSSWLNQIERWFALITNQAIRPVASERLQYAASQHSVGCRMYIQRPSVEAASVTHSFCRTAQSRGSSGLCHQVSPGWEITERLVGPQFVVTGDLLGRDASHLA